MNDSLLALSYVEAYDISYPEALNRIADEVTDAKICKVDVDQQPELARQYKVMSIPTFLVFKNGEMVKRDMGYKPKDELLDLLK